MNPYLDTFLSLFYFIVYALFTLLRWILYPLKPVWFLLNIFALPFIYIGQFFSAVITYPARQFPGSTVETLYIYLSTAALLGLLAGLILYTTSTLLKSLLQLHPSSSPPTLSSSKPAKRTLSEYRASRRAKLDTIKRHPLTDLDSAAESFLSSRSFGSSPPTLSPTMTQSPTRTGRWSRKGLLSPQTIIEEGDSDEYF